MNSVNIGARIGSPGDSCHGKQDSVHYLGGSHNERTVQAQSNNLTITKT
jgi:hypothetical protein